MYVPCYLYALQVSLMVALASYANPNPSLLLHCALSTVVVSVLTVCTEPQPILVCSYTGDTVFWVLIRGGGVRLVLFGATSDAFGRCFFLPFDYSLLFVCSFYFFICLFVYLSPCCDTFFFIVFYALPRAIIEWWCGSRVKNHF